MWWVKFAPTFVSCFYLNNSCLIVCLRRMCEVTAGVLRGNKIMEGNLEYISNGD